MTTAALFDLDGTVMDTPQAIVASLTEMTAAFGVTHPEAELRAQIGRPLDSILATLLPTTSVQERGRAAAHFRRSFGTRTLPDARHLVHPGVVRLVERLRGDGVAAAIVTSKVTASALELLAAAGLAGAFDTVVGHDQVEHGKPSPDPALLAAARLGVPPEACVVVGDSTDDIGMGVAAGTRTLGVTWGVGDAEALRAAGADAVVADLDQLEAELSRLLLGAGVSA